MIKFVYFDVGGVVIKDFSATNKWAELILELGIPETKKNEFDAFWDEYAKYLCIDIDAESLLPLIAEKFNVKIPENYSLLQNGFVDRFEYNPTIWPVIEDIRKDAKIGLLTNMYPNMLKGIKEKKLIQDIKWDTIVDSSEVKLEKPNRKIYELAEKHANVSGSEILFVDNSEGHLNAAKELGWQVYYYDSKNYDRSSEDLVKWFKTKKS